MNNPTINPLSKPVSLANNFQLTNLQPSSSILVCLAAPILIAVLMIVVWHVAKRHHQQRFAEQHVRNLSRSVPDSYYGREFIRVIFMDLFDVPNNFLELNEANFAPIRLGWLLGMTMLLGPTATMSCGYLDPAAHPTATSRISTMEFWVDFELDGQRWAIWYPDAKSAVTHRPTFGRRYISSTHRRHSQEEITDWLRKNNLSTFIPTPRPETSGAELS